MSDAGRPEGPPPPRVGDVIYVPDELYLEHGRDDRRGGRARVQGVSVRKSAGRPCCFVEVEEDPGTLHNWSSFLGPLQDELAELHGAERTRAAPDERREFNPPPATAAAVRHGPRAVPATWRETANSEFPYAAAVGGHRWVLRINDFPERDFFTLIEDGEEIEDFNYDELPALWIFPWGAGPPPEEP